MSEVRYLFALKYTSSFSELQKYLDEKLQDYIDEKALDAKWRYEEEIKILTEYVYNNEGALKEMCMMAFLGYLAKKTGLKVSNVAIQCPFLLYLLGVLSFDVLEENDKKNRVYPKAKINSTAYHVDDEFYQEAKKDIEEYLEQSGYTSIWIGSSDVSKSHEIDREPVGILVVPKENDILEHKSELGFLVDGSECVKEEHSLELYEYGIMYQLIPMREVNKHMTDVEACAIKQYICGNMDKQTAIQFIASEQIICSCEEEHDYYDRMKEYGDEVFSREALYEYLISCGMDAEKAWYWMEIIRKGTMERKLRHHLISYQDYTDLYLAVGKERMNLFCKIHYIPSCWDVLEWFYRSIQKKN